MSTNKSENSVLSNNYFIISDDSSDEVEQSENGTQTIVYGRGKGKSRRLYEKSINKGIRQITPRKKLKKKQIFIMDWKKFHQLNAIYTFMDNLERDFPAICTVLVIGKSVEGRDIKMMKISNSIASNPAVWLDAAIHSREWISTAVVTYIANYIVRNFKELPISIKNKDWYIVPVLNPDGYEYTHTKDRMWRKNRARHHGVCVGVDLNRNFSCGWGCNGEEGSSDDPNHVFYRGPAPFSEPETVAVRAIYETSGCIYKVGCTKDLTYNACGTSIDWSYGIAKIPYSYMVELRSKKYKFRLPKDQIEETCVEIWNAVKKLMGFIDQPFKSGDPKP